MKKQTKEQKLKMLGKNNSNNYVICISELYNFTIGNLYKSKYDNLGREVVIDECGKERTIGNLNSFFKLLQYDFKNKCFIV